MILCNRGSYHIKNFYSKAPEKERPLSETPVIRMWQLVWKRAGTGLRVLRVPRPCGCFGNSPEGWDWMNDSLWRIQGTCTSVVAMEGSYKQPLCLNINWFTGVPRARKPTGLLSDTQLLGPNKLLELLGGIGEHFGRAVGPLVKKLFSPGLCCGEGRVSCWGTHGCPVCGDKDQRWGHLARMLAGHVGLGGVTNCPFEPL